MLQVIEGVPRRAGVQQALEGVLKSELTSVGVRTIGFPGGNQQLEVFTFGKGRLWCAFGRAEDRPNRSYWTAFGLYDPDRTSLDITVEINIGFNQSDQVAGVIATDQQSKRDYFLHTGRIAGGYPGVGMTAFLAWSDWSRARMVEVYNGERLATIAVLLGAVAPEIASPIELYVREVAGFKQWVRERNGDVSSLKVGIEALDRYRREAADRRRRRALPETDIVVIHGDIVDALMEARKKNCKPSEKPFNTPLIDLYVNRRKKHFEVYEVKTSIDRQALYTAIGQLMVHGPTGSDARLFLVVPEGNLPNDVNYAVDELGIELMRWRETKGGYAFVPEPGGT